MNETEVNKKMSEVVRIIRQDMASIRTGRASVSLVEEIEVPAYGGASRLKVVELASINIPDPQTIVIEPWDKTVIGEIRKGILASNTGLNPTIDGEILRISLPPMTTEDRQKYVKLLGTKVENGKIMIRQIRTDAMKDIKDSFESGELSEDERFASEKRLQEITDEYTDQIETLGKEKEKQLLREV